MQDMQSTLFIETLIRLRSVYPMNKLFSNINLHIALPKMEINVI
jgi:hypothetical protein